MEHLSSLDVALLLGWLAAMVALGLVLRPKTADPSEFAVAGRRLPGWALTLSIVATETSTVTFLSVPSLAYSGDLRFLQLPLGYLIGRMLVARFLISAYFRGDLLSAYEVLGQRFGPFLRRLASLVFLLARTVGDGLRLFLGALVLNNLLDLSDLWSVGLLGSATILYTWMGGMRTVIWSDVLQFAVYGLGAVWVAVMLLGQYSAFDGSWSDWIAPLQDPDKLRVFDFSFKFDDGFTFWAALLGGSVLSMGTHGVDQMFVQRYLCTSSPDVAKRAVIASGLIVFFQFGLFLLIGSGLYLWAQNHQPVLELERDQELLSFILKELPSGVRGILLGSVFAAAMSTLSSSLHSSATALSSDFYPRREASARTQYRALRSYTVLFGVLQMCVATYAFRMDQTVVQGALSVASFASGLLLGLFLAGNQRSNTSQWAGVIGFSLGLASVTYVAFQTNIAWPWYSPLGAGVTWAGVALSRGWLSPSETKAA